jgi:hypothetical protein
VFFHQFEDLAGAAVSVFDGSDPGHYGAAHAFSGGGVGNDLPAAAVGDFYHQFQFALRVGRLGHFVGAPTIVGIDVDDICSPPDLVANDAGELIESIGSFRAEGYRNVVGKAFRALATGGHHCLTGHDHARPLDDAFFDGFLQSDVDVAGAFRAKIMDGDEAGTNRFSCMDAPSNGALGVRFFEHLVVPVGFVVRVEQEVAVTFNHAGQEGAVGEVERGAACGDIDVLLDVKGRDLIVQKEDDLAFLKILAVEYAGGADQGAGFLGK